ncbi:MAG TPA: hypothetical protein PKE45_13930 [Caldilineaceae bacterium]|nr:hypothetical protein [Caldilineaceae bacterium]
MNAILLCGTSPQEMDCINVDAILVKFSDGHTLALTEKSLRQVDLALLDATEALPEWMRKKVEELRAGGAKVLVAH